MPAEERQVPAAVVARAKVALERTLKRRRALGQDVRVAKGPYHKGLSNVRLVFEVNGKMIPAYFHPGRNVWLTVYRDNEKKPRKRRDRDVPAISDLLNRWPRGRLPPWCTDLADLAGVAMDSTGGKDGLVANVLFNVVAYVRKRTKEEITQGE
jgi:hypothetical protein